jgi:vancomycin resistance protein YoaR
MKKIRRFIPAVGVFFVAAAVLFGSHAYLRAEEEPRIAKGVYIGNVDVGDMTADEAEAAVEAYVQSVKNASITLTAGENSVTVSADAFGIAFSGDNVINTAMDICKSGNIIKRYKDTKDLENGSKVVEMSLTVDHDTVEALLEEKADELNQEAKDYGLVRESSGFSIIDGAQGIAVNVENSIQEVEDFFNDNWDGTDASVELAADIVEPKGSREELEAVKDVLGSYHTNFSSSTENRCENIRLATSKIDGTVLYPGEEFSVYESIGPIDQASGYMLAGAYENGTTVESYGGGVCQVSTTLYNAVLLAELETTERFNHSMTVTYVSPSMDAAIAGDYKDLKFVNNTETPIYLEGYVSGKDVYFTIYGKETRPSNRKVSYESEVVSVEEPATQFVATSDPAGSLVKVQGSHTGYVARLWKIVTVDGVEESREVWNNSTYRSSPKIINVGTASEDPNVTAAINAAVATGDEATIYAAVAPYNASASSVLTPPADTTTETPAEGTPEQSSETTSETPAEQTPEQPSETPAEQSSEAQTDTTSEAAAENAQ